VRIRVVAKYLQGPGVAETQALHQKMSEFWADVSPYEFSTPSSNEIDSEDVEIKAATLRQMMSDVISRERLDLGLARRILRKSRQFRVRAILEQLLDNFDFFAPVITSVVLYLDLDAVTTLAVAKNLRAKYLALISSRSAKFAHVRHWLEYFFALKYKHFSGQEVDQFLSQGAISNQAIAALTSKGLAWIREQRKLIDTFGRLDRREIIHAAGILTGAERTKWLERIDRSSSDFLEKTTIKWVSGFR